MLRSGRAIGDSVSIRPKATFPPKRCGSTIAVSWLSFSCSPRCTFCAWCSKSYTNLTSWSGPHPRTPRPSNSNTFNYMSAFTSVDSASTDLHAMWPTFILRNAHCVFCSIVYKEQCMGQVISLFHADVRYYQILNSVYGLTRKNKFF